jgi:hypothetical protein
MQVPRQQQQQIHNTSRTHHPLHAAAPVRHRAYRHCKRVSLITSSAAFDVSGCVDTVIMCQPVLL